MPSTKASSSTRAAIYARYSSDKQEARSIDDQVALCRRHAERQGWTVVASYADREVSGASVHGRSGFDRLLADARSGHFDVVLAEDIDRLARKQVDTLVLRERLEFIGIAIHTVADGQVSKLAAGIRGLMSEMFLDNLALHIRRGQAGRVAEGRAGGGLTYGYDVLAPEFPAGAKKPRRGGRAINEGEAAIVRRIFGEYVGGRRPREIVAGLNRDGIAPPRGGEWRASALVGNVQRGSGILNNEIYAGRLAWNKVRMVKNPDTGRRVSRPNPVSEWQVVEVPALRIVDDDTFARAQAVRIERSHDRPQLRRTPRRLFSGLLRCGCCGAGMALKDAANSRYRRIQCSRMKEAGTCAHRAAYAIAPIEERVLANLQRHLREPAVIERFITSYQAERKRLAAASDGRKRTVEKRLGEVRREIGRLVQAIAKGAAMAEEIAPAMTALSTERKRLEAELATDPGNIIALHPTAVSRYLAAVEQLGLTLAEGIDAGNQGPQLLRELIEAIVVSPPIAGTSEPAIEIRGRLAKLAGADLFPQAKKLGCLLVAEEGYRRTPQSTGPIFSIAA